MEDETQDYRTRIYSNYRTGHGKSERDDDRGSRAPYLRAMVQKYFPRNREAHIVDLGCGSGTLLYFLEEAGYTNCRGIDASPEQVTAAHQLGIADVQQGDVFDTLYNTAGDTLDVVVTFDVIEHMTKPELLRFADMVFYVLKAGGRWIIHAPNAESPFGAGIRYSDWTHEQAFTRVSITQLLTTVGFAHVECYEDQPTKHGAKSTARWLSWKVVRTLLRLYVIAETGSRGREAIFSRNLVAVAIK